MASFATPSPASREQGRASSKTHFVEVDGDFSVYSVFGHRHTGEMLEQLELCSESLQFTPHLLPIPRGILSTIYVRLVKPVPAAELEQCLRQFYDGKPWVRIFGTERLPQIKFSRNTNFCDIGFSLSPDGKRAVLVSCLDNLLKGAAGQAVQNMNLMFGLDERGIAMKLVIKIGGAALDDRELVSKFAKTIPNLCREGHKVVIVHGGGAALSRALKQLGCETTFINGLRVTDAQTRDVAVMVLAGHLNKLLVAAIGEAGQPSLGICGDLECFARRKKSSPGWGTWAKSARWTHSGWSDCGMRALFPWCRAWHWASIASTTT